MKVLVLSNKVAYPAYDGSSIAIRSSVEALRSQGAAVSLYSLNTEKHRQSEAAIAAASPPALDHQTFAVSTRPSWPSALRNLWQEESYFVSRFRQKILGEALVQRLSSEDFDWIQLEGLSMATYLPLLRKHSQARIALRAHNIEHQIWQRHCEHLRPGPQRSYLALQSRRLEKFEKQSLEACDALLFITNEDQAQYRAWGGQQPSMVLPCGIEPAEYPPIDNRQTDYQLVHLASMDWLPNQQGIEWFVEQVWPLIRAEAPGCRFALGGRHQPARWRTWTAQGIDLFPAVDSAADFVARGQLMVIPLLAGSGMRIKILENMARGLAMVSTPVGAEGIDLKTGEEILLAEKPAAFAQACLRLLRNQAEAQAMGRAARAKALQRYSNSILGAALVSFYQAQS